MTEQELAAIEKRVNAATREPWIVSGTYVPTASLSAVSVYGMGMEVAECQMDTDGAFIAAARVDVPALIAEVRRLRALVELAYREGFWDGEGTVEKHVGYGDTAWWMSDARRATKEEA